MGQLEGWFKSWVPESVFSAGGGRGSVEAWYTSAIDIEEALSGAADSHVHFFVADVVKSFDTVDRVILDCVLCSLGLPGWFRHAYFEYHAHVRLRFKLASGLGEPWTRNGGSVGSQVPTLVGDLAGEAWSQPGDEPMHSVPGKIKCLCPSGVCCAWCVGSTEDTATNIFLSWAAPRSPKVGSQYIPGHGEGTTGGGWRRGLQVDMPVVFNVELIEVCLCHRSRSFSWR